MLLLLDPDQLLAEVLDDEGEEPVAVEGVALIILTITIIVDYCIIISYRGT